MSNINCYSCDFCNSCNSCNSCNCCNCCNSCDSCNSCNACDSCNSCNACYYCNYCNACYYCNYCNYCYSCKGLRMSEYMLFCLGDGSIESEGEGYQKNNRIFNIAVTHDEYLNARESLPNLVLPITRWVKESDMTKEEKKNKPIYKDIGGYLKVLSYEDAWKVAWEEMSKSDRQKFLDLPHFNKDIFKEITGLDVDTKRETITIGGLIYDKDEVETKLKDIKPIHQ